MAECGRPRHARSRRDTPLLASKLYQLTENTLEMFLQRPDGCRLFYTVDDYTDAWRPAPTVLFVHGLAESGEAWRAWVPHFARRYRVVRVDLRGFGRSTPMPEEYEWTIDALVDDLIGL